MTQTNYFKIHRRLIGYAQEHATAKEAVYLSSFDRMLESETMLSERQTQTLFSIVRAVRYRLEASRKLLEQFGDLCASREGREVLRLIG